MAKNFLALVNDVLKEASIIQGDAGELTSFTDSARQIDVDMTISAINNVIAEIYSHPNELPRSQLEGRFTLATSRREYSLATDFEMMAFDIIRNEENGNAITPYPGGFEKMWRDQPTPSDFKGQPFFYVINPENGKIRLDTQATSSEKGDVYRYKYIRSLTLSAIADLLPFSDVAAVSLTPAFAQLFKKKRDPEKFDPGLFRASLAQGLRWIRQQRPSGRYGVA